MSILTSVSRYSAIWGLKITLFTLQKLRLDNQQILISDLLSLEEDCQICQIIRVYDAQFSNTMLRKCEGKYSEAEDALT